MAALDEDEGRRPAQNIRTSVSLAETVEDVDIVMEYVFEDIDLKRGLFAELDRLCPERTILATGTSSLMPSDLATATSRPDKVLAAHYANPPYLLPFVEIVGAEGCSPESIQTVVDLLAGMGKQPVVLQKEIPGFAAMRLQGALLREAVARGELGVKTGKGFYEWTPESEEALRRRIANALIEIDRWPGDDAGATLRP